MYVESGAHGVGGVDVEEVPRLRKNLTSLGLLQQRAQLLGHGGGSSGGHVFCGCVDRLSDLEERCEHTAKETDRMQPRGALAPSARGGAWGEWAEDVRERVRVFGVW